MYQYIRLMINIDIYKEFLINYIKKYNKNYRTYIKKKIMQLKLTNKYRAIYNIIIKK